MGIEEFPRWFESEEKESDPAFLGKALVVSGDSSSGKDSIILDQ